MHMLNGCVEGIQCEYVHLVVKWGLTFLDWAFSYL